MRYVAECIGDLAIDLATAGLKTAWCPERTEDLSLEARARACAEDSSDVAHCIQYVHSSEAETDVPNREAVDSTMAQDREVEMDPVGRARAKQ